jgi:lincosamide nucleotidyltransferase A/C/D/E
VRPVTADDVLEFLARLEAVGIDVWVDGGWGVDALVGRQTRPHADLDIAIRAADAEAFKEHTRDYAVHRVDNEHNWVLVDERGRMVDVHLVDFDSTRTDEHGVEVYGPAGLAYDVGSLDGTGAIGGRAVRCVTAEALVRFHTGYEVDAGDFTDVLVLHEHFGIPIPPVYAERGFTP